MAEHPPGGPSGFIDVLKALAPYAPGLAGAVFSMAFGEKLTIRGKLLSASVGVASALWLAPFLCCLIDWLWWPGDGVPTIVASMIGFTSGLFGMIVLAGLAQALARYSKDPLSLVRIQFGGATIGGRPEGEGGA
jgi:hypothetical protein